MARPWEQYGQTEAAAPWTKYATATEPAPEPTLMEGATQQAKNLVGGAVRGAGSIGATLLTPVDALARVLGVQNSYIGRNDRRQAMDDGLREAGANPDSLAYGAGKIGAEIAGTGGVGSALGKGVGALAATRLGAGIEPLLNGAARALQTGGFRVGELAGTSAALPTRLLAGAITGGASAGLVNPGDAGMGAVVGAAIPGAVQGAGMAGRMIGRGLSGSGVSPEVAKLAQRAQELGINVPADRIVDSKPLNAIASTLNYIPMSGRAGTENAMNAQLNTALSRTFGQDSPNVTAALRKAGPELGGKFDAVLKSNTVKIDPQFFNEISDITNTASKELGSDGLRAITSQVDELIQKGANGTIDGQAAYNIKRTLDRIAKRNTPEAYHAQELRKSLMGALDRSIGPEAAADFAKTRQQYGNMLSLERLAKNGAEGDISVARLANMKGINNQPLQELADIAAQFVKPREGIHGQAQRAVTGGVGASLAGLPATVGLMGAGRVANMGLNSQAARNALLRTPSLLGEPASLGLLGYATQRSAPLLGAGLLNDR